MTNSKEYRILREACSRIPLKRRRPGAEKTDEGSRRGPSVARLVSPATSSGGNGSRSPPGL